jgi:hypothetical protein
MLIRKRVHTQELATQGSFRALEPGKALFVLGMDPHKIHTLQTDDTPPFRVGRVILSFPGKFRLFFLLL